jgi:hypothetical protein
MAPTGGGIVHWLKQLVRKLLQLVPRQEQLAACRQK